MTNNTVQQMLIDFNKEFTKIVLPDDAVTVITKGTTINGSISSDGSLEINGTITGDVECLGKLSITGKVVGNSSASEVYVNTERLQGSITSEGSVKVGLGTVVIGDIVATSGVIAGAVKGEIDVNGPIVIDSTAIIKGNIKAKTVQINNGAVVEGFCSLSYSEVDVDNIFE
jgi:cytoskeletal protein CcmA (bactofilin family)